LGKMCHGKFTMPRRRAGGNITEAAVRTPTGFSATILISSSL
jgi:hypothetical protein